MVGPKGAPPKRIQLDLLGQLVVQLQEALRDVAADLGLSPDEIPPAELIDLAGSSTVLVVEQESPASSAGPLSLVSEAMADKARGQPYNKIFTRRATDRLDEFAALLGRLNSEGYPVGVEHSLNGHLPPLEEAQFVVVGIPAPEGAEQLDVEDQEDYEVEAPATPSTVSDWLVRFTADIHQLSREHVIWLKVGGTSLSLKRPLSEELFQIADSDDARWKLVEITALATSQTLTSIVEILSVRPASVKIETDFMPLTEAAEQMREYVDRIERLADLDRDWDTYGAKRISAESIKAARAFMILAAAQSNTEGLTLPPPHIVPVSNGAVQLEWESGELGLELEFIGTRIEYLRTVAEDFVEGTATKARALELVAWLHEGARHG